MAHRALTLKYRPQVFSDLIGQDHVSHVLERSIESGRVAHAYLFTGARGVGKTTSARILAKALNCPNRGLHGRAADPCNECTSCTEITSGIALDVAEIDGASNRGIADVQALREKVRFAPTGGRHRIVIIDEVHQLSNDAFAALLKTLEEPPAHLVFIFATTDPQKMPDTIRSRTQRFDFARVPLRKVADRLLDIQKREAADADGAHFELADGAALLIAHKGEGSMRDSVSGLDQVVSSGEASIDEALVRQVLGIADREAFFEIAGAVVRHDPKEALHALHRAFDKGVDPRDLAEGLTEHVRHILILKVDPEGGDMVAMSGEDVARLKSQGEGWTEDDLLRLLRITSDVMWPMKDSPQPLVHLEAAVLQMATLERGGTLTELLVRLEEIEQRLGGAGDAPPPAAAAPRVQPARPAAAPGPAAPAPGRAPSPAAPSTAAGTAAGTPGAATPADAPSARATPSLAGVPRRKEDAPPPDRTPRASGDKAPAPTATASAPPASAASAGAAPRPAPSRRPLPSITSAPLVAGATAAAAALDDAPLPALDAETETRWKQVVARVHERKRMLGAFISESHLIGADAGSVVVAMDDLHRSVVADKENHAIVSDEIRHVFGAGTALRCMPLAMAGDTARKPTAEETQAMVAKTVEWFQGDSMPQKRRNERAE